MDVQANTMSNSMSKVLAVSCRLDNVSRNFIKLTETESSLGFRNECLVGFQDRFVNFSFLVADMTCINGPGH